MLLEIKKKGINKMQTTIKLNRTTSIEINFNNDKLTISGTYDGGCGQCQDEIKKGFKDDKQVVRLIEIWDEYHLNNLTAGTPNQETYLKPMIKPPEIGHFDWACKELKAIDYLWDIHDGQPYEYGSSWLLTPIPKSIIKELEGLIKTLSDRYEQLNKGTSMYDSMADDFLKSTDTEITFKFLEYNYHFDGDKDKRDIYKVTLKRGVRSYTFNFGNSIADSGYFLKGKRQLLLSDRITISDKKKFIPFVSSKRVSNRPSEWLHWAGVDIHETITVKEPTPYCVLACLQNSNPGTFEDFCDNFGYETDSRRAEKTYNAVVDEYKNLAMLYNDTELEQLAEVQ